MRDAQRQKIYNAEQAWRMDSKVERISFEEAQHVVDMLSEEYEVKAPRVVVGPMHRFTAGFYQLGTITLNDRYPNVTITTVLHEYAHHLSRERGQRFRGHGGDFVEAFIEVVDTWLGEEDAERLKAVFEKRNIPTTTAEELELRKAAKQATQRRLEREGETGTVYAVLVDIKGAFRYVADRRQYFVSEDAKVWRRRSSAEKMAESWSNRGRRETRVVELEGVYEIVGYRSSTPTWRATYDSIREVRAKAQSDRGGSGLTELEDLFRF